jgi:hypothetical protein
MKIDKILKSNFLPQCQCKHAMYKYAHKNIEICLQNTEETNVQP